MSEPLYKVKAEFFKTLGHPARIRVLELLAAGDKSVAELLMVARKVLTGVISDRVAVLEDLRAGTAQ